MNSKKPPKVRVISYRRVSTEQQGESEIELDAQRVEIATFAKERGYNVVKDYREVASGKLSVHDRPALKLALKDAKEKKLPIIVASQDRLFRGRNCRKRDGEVQHHFRSRRREPRPSRHEGRRSTGRI